MKLKIIKEAGCIPQWEVDYESDDLEKIKESFLPRDLPFLFPTHADFYEAVGCNKRLIDHFDPDGDSFNPDNSLGFRKFLLQMDEEQAKKFIEVIAEKIRGYKVEKEI